MPQRPTLRREQPPDHAAGILIGAAEGLVQVLPGERPRTVLEHGPVIAVDHRGARALAVVEGRGVWLAEPHGWREVWSGDARRARIAPDGALWIGARGRRLLRSDDGGQRWEPAPSFESVLRYERNRGRAGATREREIAAIAFPGDGMLVAVAGAGAWLSADGGRSWMPRSDGLDLEVSGIWEHPERPERLYAATDAGLFRSDDAGFTWLQSLGGLDRSVAAAVAVLPAAPDAIVLSAARRRDEDGTPVEGALFRSANGGVTWARLSLGDRYEWPSAPLVARLSDSPDTAFAVAGGRAWGSHDRGQHWLPVAHGLPEPLAMSAAF